MVNYDKIKLIIFDMDGVLVDSKDSHYESLNMALKSIDDKYVVTYEDHIKKYDGNPTNVKLKMLTSEKGLPETLHKEIWTLKQKYYIDIVNNTFVHDDKIIKVLKQLKSDNYTLHCASNCIYETLKLMLDKKGFTPYLDYIISNEDVTLPKPNPEMYLKCLIKGKVTPKETLILEDSVIGKLSAYSSGAHLMPIKSPNDIIYDDIIHHVKYSEFKNTGGTCNNNINIVMPMAGLGSRFIKCGYTLPKPLIRVFDKPMIELVIDNLNIDGNYIFIVRKEHIEEYKLDVLLKNKVKQCTIIPIDYTTEGATCSVLLAEQYINNNNPLIIANCDQYLEWDVNEFLYSAVSKDVDGAISTFNSNETKWSYAKLDSNNKYVTEVAEKRPISEHATTGIYYWKKGNEFVKYAKQMMSKNIRVNGEFYVCPVYNEAILDNRKIIIKDCVKMWGIGVPEDLEYFVQKFDKRTLLIQK